LKKNYFGEKNGYRRYLCCSKKICHLQLSRKLKFYILNSIYRIHGHVSRWNETTVDMVEGEKQTDPETGG
jgi:hypothetical protein